MTAAGRWMTAAVLHGQKDVRIESLPAPVPGPGEVVVAVRAALTDGTDLKVFRRGYHARMLTPPTPFGHEFAGEIAELGPGGEGWAVGDAVVAANSAPCGACFHCERGEESLCEDLIFVNGAYAPYLLLPRRVVEKNLLSVPSGVDWAAAAVTEPLACVVRGMRDLEVRSGETTAVIGSGPIGLMAVCLAVHAGARVVLVGRRQHQLAIGEEMGAQTRAAPESAGDLPALLRELNGGRGPDRVFEATGTPAIWEAAIETVRPGGVVNLFGGCPAGTRVSFDTNRLHYGEVTLRSSFHHTPTDIRSALDLITRGVVHPHRFFDGAEPLSALPRVLQEMDDRIRTLKTVILPSPAANNSGKGGRNEA